MDRVYLEAPKALKRIVGSPQNDSIWSNGIRVSYNYKVNSTLGSHPQVGVEANAIKRFGGFLEMTPTLYFFHDKHASTMHNLTNRALELYKYQNVPNVLM